MAHDEEVVEYVKADGSRLLISRGADGKVQIRSATGYEVARSTFREGVWTARSECFDLLGTGPSERAAVTDLKRLVVSFLEELRARSGGRMLDDTLAKLGWRRSTRRELLLVVGR